MNSDFDLDVLSAELDSILDIDMSDFGFDLGEDFSPDDFGEDFSLPDGEKPEMCTMSFTLHAEQKSLIEYAMSLVADDVKETFGNTNKNGNALYEVVRQWAEQRK
jgi:ABC-type sulfate transport system substrate-binding protein